VANNNYIKQLNEIFLKSTILIIYNFEKYIEEPGEEYLHQVRVSARKLENLFETFGKLSVHKDYSTYLKIIKDIIKLFSSKREIDVCLIMTLDYFRIVKTENLLFKNFFLHLQKQNKKLGNGIFKSKKLMSFIQKKESLVKFVRTDLFSDSINISKSDAKVYLMNTIPALYKKFMAYKDEVINNPENKNTLHKMRLKAKPLRYTIDLLIEMFEIKFPFQNNNIKNFVNTAGYIHDIDMLIERIDTYIQLVREIQRKDSRIVKDGSLKLFRKHLLKTRESTYNSLINILTELDSENFGDKLFRFDK